MKDAASVKIKIEPSDHIFEELGNNTYTFPDLISELIDNAIAAKVEGELLEVKIEVGISNDRKSSYFCISDNASGISRERLGQAISPGARKGQGLNEHGLGLKQAVASLGKLQHLLTKTVDDKDAVLVPAFGFGEFNFPTKSVGWKHGTEIRCTHLKAITPMMLTHYTRDVIDLLGARYRRYLLPDAQKMRLSLTLIDVDDGNKVLQSHQIKPVSPVYFHPSTRTNKPVLNKETIKGKGWEVELTFGYAPESEKEYAELGIERPSKFHPYSVSLKKQGLDLILHDRVISFHMLSQIGLIESPHNDYNLVRGEIDLKKGFTTAITKNAIIQDEKFGECIAAVIELLSKKNYLHRRTYPDELPEAVLRDRLANWLKTNKLSPKKDVKTEYGVQGLSGSIDILADGEAWEIKRDDANGLDVYQLFAYLDMGNFSKGYLVAKSFSSGCQAAADHIIKNHGKTIALAPFDDVPIVFPMTEEERKKYF